MPSPAERKALHPHGFRFLWRGGIVDSSCWAKEEFALILHKISPKGDKIWLQVFQNDCKFFWTKRFCHLHSQYFVVFKYDFLRKHVCVFFLLYCNRSQKINVTNYIMQKWCVAINFWSNWDMQAKWGSGANGATFSSCPKLDRANLSLILKRWKLLLLSPAVCVASNCAKRPV